MKHLRTTLVLATLILVPANALLARQVQLSELQKLEPTNLVGADKHGAWVALDGERLLIGAPESATTGPGRVYAYSRAGSSWTLDQKFTFLVGGPGSTFGRRIALDGSTCVVGNKGSAFVYALSGGSWVLQQWITASVDDFFASSLALDGDTVLIGQPTTADNQVWVWVRSGTQWSLQAKLEPPNPPQTIGFGDAVALVGDTALVGATTDDEAASNAGAVFVFRRSGTAWSLQAKLLGSPAYANRRLGRALAAQQRPGGLIELVAGAPGPTVGEAQVFVGSGANWTQTARVQASTGGSGGWFGNAVALDGERMVVGAWLGDGGPDDTGLATVYRRCGDDWIRQADLLGSDSTTGDNFGVALALQGDTVVVGAPFHDLVGPDGGSSYAFDLGTAPLALFCAGDGSGASCPCGNEVAPGDAAGCANSTGGGALLVLDDALQVSDDELSAHACGLVPSEPALLFAGSARVAGGSGAPFGDGLRCAGTGVVRLGTTAADAAGGASWGPGLGVLGGWSAGETRHFQVWYRDPAPGPCSTGFNLSNGVSASFVP